MLSKERRIPHGLRPIFKSGLQATLVRIFRTGSRRFASRT